ncbi:metallophosphoesterase family protein [Thiocapsa roseopersicina]|uniref:Calcineurin-like phosphoesterase n=1 Tax=Thiocapsa roseopersicina TaxID=1058 RepID=A0A1H2R044_THIRO|nr:metallophosphoesterase [Thiocapsa roseopersicina]SDW12777.1 Calcineurin-like phosphoesterase [Thiocapsa roseopersicina]
MNRREFLTFGSMGLTGLALSGSNLSWLMREASAANLKSGKPWKFGVMADTQWKATADPLNPATCAVEIIETLNRQFIDAGVSFVVQVGDLVDKEYWVNPQTSVLERTLPYRAAAAQTLYDNGIGFFPLRGNHEASITAAAELPALFPQTLGEGHNLFGVSSVVASDKLNLQGLSYAFDFENVRIVMIDQFTRRDGSVNGSTNDNAVDQVDWVDAVLADRPADSHAFVMAHKNLIGQNHADCLFGSNATTNLDARNRFIGSLDRNRVGAFLGGHDHMHHRSLIASPDVSAVAEQIICASNSYKFYTPRSTPNDIQGCETVVAHELYTIGYYIFTVDGPCMTVEFYSSSHGADYGDVDLAYGPGEHVFHLRERFGYSLNGKSFDVANGESYSIVEDSFGSTEARILSGTNETLAEDVESAGRPLAKTVKTGWRETPPDSASAIFKLWGMTDNLSLYDEALTGLLPDSPGPTVSDTYVLSLSYDGTKVPAPKLRTGHFCLRAKDDKGRWVPAVDRNVGGNKRFVYGRWNGSHGLGTYGVDPDTRTVWAVLNRDGEFVAFTGPEGPKA